MATNAPPDFSKKRGVFGLPVADMREYVPGPQTIGGMTPTGVHQVLYWTASIHFQGPHEQKTLWGVLLDMLTRRTRLGGIHLRVPTLRSFCKPFHFPGNQKKPNITNIKPIRSSELEHTRVE